MQNKQIHVRGIEYYVETFGDEDLPTLVFLHGFTGNTTTWYETIEQLIDKYRIVLIDMIGHGQTTSPTSHERFAMEQQLKDLDELFSTLRLKQFTLIGYSMGGRIALAYAVNYPDRISTLVLESASPGLRTIEERENRQVADKKLSERIVSEGLQAFVDFWESIPLFETQKKLPTAKRIAIRKQRLTQDEQGLSNSLIGIGTGSQPSYWDALGSMKNPVLLVSGELDKKFVSISREMQKYIPNVQHETIKQAGHAIHVEKPLEFATMVRKYI